MPEVRELTPGEHNERVVNFAKQNLHRLKICPEWGYEVVFSRGKQRPKAGLVTGVKS